MSNEKSIKDLREKIDLLNQEAWEVRVYDSTKSLQISQEIVEQARAINYREGLALGLRSLAFALIRVSKNDEALPLINEAFGIFQSLDNLSDQAVLYEYLGIIARNKGDYGTALELFYKAQELSHHVGARENEGVQHYQLGVTYKFLGNFEKALESSFTSLSIGRELKNRLFQSYSINVIGSIYFESGDYTKALEYFQEGLTYRQESGDKHGETGSLDNIGFTYFKLQDYSLAIDYCTRSLVMSEQTGDKRSQGNALLHLAEIHRQTGDTDQAIDFSHKSLEIRKTLGDKRGETEILLFLADLNPSQAGGTGDSKVFEWLNRALTIAEEIKALDLLSRARFQLYEYYKRKQEYEEALKNLHLHINVEKEFHKNTINQKVLNIEISHKAEEAQKETEEMRLKNEELTKLNTEIQEQKKKLEEAIADLKATQAQLIQAEKMASLGELTAGIAHEIQNPLNFVNNFSDVSNELLTEMNTELEKGNAEAARSIAKDVKQNLEKILHHGQRADSIVKGMLQHSRTSSGQKESTDINVLADEYLRLAYHGLRAKDKSFSANFETDLDKSIGRISIIPQDIGRVLVNLINNAFYAVNERKKQDGSGFQPTVKISSRRLDDVIELRIIDNGNGIPAKVLDKIFQPFFTTKPAGKGTGLGLSLSYDIITKGHGGELKVETREGEGSAFIIQLPIGKNTLP